MLDLTVNDGGYLTVDTDAWLDDISEVSETWTDVFNAYCAMRAQSEYSFYVTDSVVRDWADSLGTATGIYGEDGPFSMETCNYDTFLENEIAYTFLHLERNVQIIREDGEVEYETHHDALVIVHGYGYSYATPDSVEVRVFIGDADADIVSHSSGYAAHEHKECGAEWILNDTVTLWPNGGGESFRIDECIREDDNGSHLFCPMCGDTLIPYTH